MGFRLDRTYVLQFEGAMEGAYIKLRATPIGTVMKLRGGDSASNTELVELLAEYVLDWNFEDADGEPLPVTAEAMLAELEQVVIVKVITEWYKAAVGVTAPLDPPGADGTLTDVDIPMEPVTA